ncbi:type II toxin-antitoxin system VapC family toxin [Roseofilum capinflatum]|uniref:Type II toxin-antitoxin system VapC family toxin n=1 Tax=Roseofilum capinflatum BLCC-M114 TaxID=3022440 RepID=A0ABT7B3R9_9CYAN|nr:type II toxin-antitoxin system VapC family toxin [Roseofilum capinflatum]MDJ1173823.1 type II toxin-antitoxin system VapC family toxin [Roseofilum capinflatum BLCC-M114]
MTIYFLDSSALVKRYLNEIGSTWVVRLCDRSLNHELFVVAITAVEVIAAITRRSRGGSISISDATLARDQFRFDLHNQYQVIEITEIIINSAMTLSETYGLRGYDAIQLAAGCAVHSACITNQLPALIFVSADHELNLAAASEGLRVENPNAYP